MSAELSLEKYVIAGLLGLVFLLLLLLCSVYRTKKEHLKLLKDKKKRRAPSEHRSHGEQFGNDEIYPCNQQAVTRCLDFPRRFVFVRATSRAYFSRCLLDLSSCLFFRLWQKYRHGRVIPSSSPESKMAKDTGAEAFPLSRLLTSPGIVVAYSREFVNDFASGRSPRREAGHKRYALILKSASREAKADLHTYFEAVLEDILNVRQVSLFTLFISVT